jgi:hypothetical protein
MSEFLLTLDLICERTSFALSFSSLFLGALRDKGDCRHDTLYAIRDILSGAKLIFEEGGKWYYTCKKEKEELLKDYQEFKNKDEYDTKLNHSKNLLKQAIAEEESNEFNVDLYHGRSFFGSSSKDKRGNFRKRR